MSLFKKERTEVKDLYYIHIFKLSEGVEQLNKKLDDIREILLEIKKESKPKKEEVVPVKMRTKQAIKLFLKRHGKVTPSMLANVIGLSRTRCNEYLKEMEEEGIVKGEIEGKKKFYTLIKP